MELVVAMAVSAVLGAAALGYFRSQTAALATHSVTLEAADKVRAAMTLLVRELRGTGYDPRAAALLAPGFKGVRFASSSAVWIELDRDGDGVIQGGATDPSAESILYSYDGTAQRLVRTAGGVAQTLIADIPPGALSFSYFSKAGVELAPSSVAALSLPPGYPSLPSVVTQALSGSALSATDRDSIAMIRVTLRVNTAGAVATTLGMSTRVSVPNRLLDRL